METSKCPYIKAFFTLVFQSLTSILRTQRGLRQAPECLDSGHISVRSRELLKAGNRRFYRCSPFVGTCPHAFSASNTAGRRAAIVSTCSTLPGRFTITVSTQSAINLVGILVAFLGWSPIKLFSPVLLISAVRLVGNSHFDNSLR
jgi:hypothetical protein